MAGFRTHKTELLVAVSIAVLTAMGESVAENSSGNSPLASVGDMPLQASAASFALSAQPLASRDAFVVDRAGAGRGATDPLADGLSVPPQQTLKTLAVKP